MVVKLKECLVKGNSTSEFEYLLKFDLEMGGFLLSEQLGEEFTTYLTRPNKLQYDKENRLLHIGKASFVEFMAYGDAIDVRLVFNKTEYSANKAKTVIQEIYDKMDLMVKKTLSDPWLRSFSFWKPSPEMEPSNA
ncbi:hypothetical protein [Sediminitomix flava]|uniref:Uncharacterized protein n=1 Tax=Sediminitomix flava TaxID=379075 RepID=A0A315ZBC6_SEDFL|nr:hypothetical protein [Sediminitomix flava]PWJ42886.1 hypothetical protein BC781_102432 [Sediminitomix flava]